MKQSDNEKTRSTNPYSASIHTEPNELAGETHSETHSETDRVQVPDLPSALYYPTRRALCLFGAYQFLTSIVLDSWIFPFPVDFLALVILLTGATMSRRSYRRFPLIILMCLIYPFRAASSVYMTLTSTHAIGSRPIVWQEFVVWIGLLIACVAACYCNVLMYRCYQYQEESQNKNSVIEESHRGVS